MVSDVYEVRVRGAVSYEQITDLCTDLELDADILIHGVVRDQAVMHGLLDRLRCLGLQLVDAHKMTGVQPSPSMTSPEIPGCQNPPMT